jgi:predicted nucleic acid-binding protein
MIVVDSSVWIDLIRDRKSGSTSLLAEGAREGQIILGDLILMEVLRGARDERHAAALQRSFAAFPVSQMVDPSLAVQAAANYRLLRGKGRTIRSSIELLIASYCIRHDYALLQRDRDFQPMAEHLGLKLM